jgi:hypothetical protein
MKIVIGLLVTGAIIFGLVILGIYSFERAAKKFRREIEKWERGSSGF